jgi:hypothetical protein
MWIGVAPRTEIRRHMCLQEINLHVKNMITIMGLMVTMIGGEGSLIEHEDPHFENEECILMSSKKL